MNNQNQAVMAEIKSLRKDVNHILQNYVTSDKFDRLVVEVMRNGRDIAELKEMKSVVLEIRDEVRRQAERMDGYAKDAQKVFDNDRIHDWYIKDHEIRISRLESR